MNAKEAREYYKAPEGSTAPGQPPVQPRAVTITMTRVDAEELSFALSDLLCWHQGYAAAKGDDTAHAPMGVEAARDLNIKLKRAIKEANRD